MAREGQLAVLFPGQGSQTRGMRELVARLRPDLLELAPAIVGEDPFALVEEGTRFAQPAIFCAALAGWDDLKTELRPDFLAGHSLGELTALAAAGALSDTDALRLVAPPVRWLDVLRALRARGVERFVETGPGRVLTGLVRHSLDGVEAEAPVRLEPAHA